jgi:hypothetical protein
LYEEEWSRFTHEVIPAIMPKLKSIKDPALISFLIDSAYLPVPKNVVRGLAVLALNDWAPGYAFLALERLLRGTPTDRDIAILDKLYASATLPELIPYSFAYGLDAVAKSRSPRIAFTWNPGEVGDTEADKLSRVMLWLSCIAFEAVGVMNPIDDVASVLSGFELKPLFNTRSYYLDANGPGAEEEEYDDSDEDYDDDDDDDRREKEYGVILEADRLEEVSLQRFSWIAPWCRAEIDLVDEPRGEP